MTVSRLVEAALARLRSYAPSAGPALLRLARSNARTARQSLEQVHLIARTMVAKDGYRIKTVAIKSRRQGSKLYRHNVVTRGGHMALAIIEKRSNNRREPIFYERSQDHFGEGLTDVSLQVYGIHENSLLSIPEFRTHIFLEHLPNVGLPDTSEVTAKQLARSMMKIAEIPRFGKNDVLAPPSRFDTRLLDEFIAALTDNGHVGKIVSQDEVKALRADWRSVSERAFDRMPLVPCHNDLHHLNVGRRDAQERDDFVFFDWESFGLNYLGSDLHHFISSPLVGSYCPKFSAAVQAEYAREAERSYGIARHDIDFAASSYAFYRCMIRSVRRRRDARQIRAVLTLFDRLKAIPVLP